MKTIPPPCPEPDTGPKYWRSLDQLAETPEFRQWVDREFPAGASELTDPVTRRHFVKIMSASFVLAGVGLTGCRRPEHHIYPFSKTPENYVHGVAQFYATAMATQGGAIPLLAKSNDGRPTKVEGNGSHPDSNGGTDVFAQASILNLYDPDRATRYTRQGNAVQQDAVLDYLAQLSQSARANSGTGLHFLLERSTSPSRLRLQQAIGQTLPNAQWHVFEPVDFGIHQEAATLAFGKPVKPYWKLDEADIIVSLDCDFLGAEDDAYISNRRYAQRRKIEKPADSMNRLYAVEALMTITGANADHRLRLAESAISGFAARLAIEILNQGGQSELASSLRPLADTVKAHEQWIVECAKDLLAHKGKAVVLVGHRQPMAVHLIGYAINAALGSINQVVTFSQPPQVKSTGIGELAQALNAGQVDTLVILGSNPVYSAPVDLDWANAQKKAKTVIRLGYYEDETAAGATWHLPLAHYLESWGDLRSSDGTLVPVQPLIEPLFGGISELEVLARIAGVAKPSSYDVVRETFQTIGGGDEAAWKRFLHDGFLPNSAAQNVSVQFNAGAVGQTIASLKPVPAPTKDSLEVVFYRDYRMDDGRYNNNGWLMELPDPITKMVWENVILMSPKTAQDLGLVIINHEDLKLFVPWVKVQVNGREVEGPAWIQMGQADNTLGLALGYGREKTGRIGTGSGYNTYKVRTAASLHFASGAKLSDTGRTHQIATTQDHWAMQGRPIVREATLQQFRDHPDFAKRMNAPEAPSEQPMYPNPFDAVKGQAHHQWGMVIDLNSCTGCSACMTACQSENNVPIVGKEQVKRGREMHWIRIDRYFTGEPSDPQVVNQPMLCQHCEAAPCENVCPVNATAHDQEGLNVMAYNRCVGTRYCSNNCPYKVRRFNYFDYNKRPINKLYWGPLAKRSQEELDLVKMLKNPDVTVRMRGVMEKCSFCLQRIEGAKIAQKVKAGASGDVIVPSDSFTTACAQACPTGAITFGNLLDSNSHVSKLKQQERNYAVLDFLATKPRLTYLARIRNPNPAMPDAYKTAPASFEEFSQKMGDPFAEHGHAAGHEAAEAHGAESQKGAH